MESYENGKKDEHNLTELSYGLNPKEIEQGQIDFGIIHSNENKQQVFLYAPDIKTMPQDIENNNSATITSWDYAIDESQLELGKTYLLAVYRQTEKDHIRTYDLQDEQAVEQMIQDGTWIYLLKIKIEAVHD